MTPKFCSDIELGVKGMSVQTLCRISEVLRLSTDFILFGRENTESSSPITQLLRSCSSSEQAYACLLYTSDAADDRLGVDLGGRRIIK